MPKRSIIFSITGVADPTFEKVIERADNSVSFTASAVRMSRRGAPDRTPIPSEVFAISVRVPALICPLFIKPSTTCGNKTLATNTIKRQHAGFFIASLHVRIDLYGIHGG